MDGIEGLRVKLFIVLPDVGQTKYNAIRRIGCNGRSLDVLFSYTIAKWKPSSLGRILKLREKKCIRSLMLDSGAYHLMRLGENVDVTQYASLVNKYSSSWDYVVAPDVPGSQELTLARTLEFMEYYKGSFLPVLQGSSPREYEEFYNVLQDYGVMERSYLVNNTPLVGVGGLDGEKKRVSFVAEIVRRLSNYDVMLHIFGVGIRVLKGLKRRGLLGIVYSVDSSGWLAEIQWRRRTVYRALTPLEANVAAIKGYLDRAEGLIYN